MDIRDMLRSLRPEQRSRMGPNRKRLEGLSKKGKPVTAPLPTLIRQRQERKAGYEDRVQDIAKWQPIIKVQSVPHYKERQTHEKIENVVRLVMRIGRGCLPGGSPSSR